MKNVKYLKRILTALLVYGMIFNTLSNNIHVIATNTETLQQNAEGSDTAERNEEAAVAVVEETTVDAAEEAAVEDEEADVAEEQNLSSAAVEAETLPAEADGNDDAAVLNHADTPVAENDSPQTNAAREQGTDSFNSSITFSTPQYQYFGGEIITIYNNISVSGNQTTLEEGAYTVITLPKDEFQKPKESDVSTSFDNFKDLEIIETADSYQIITTYKTTYGGYTGGTPVKVNLLPRETVNLSEHKITQEFFDKDGNQLTPSSELTVEGKARLETLGNNSYSTVRLQSQVDENYVIRPGTEATFTVGYSSPSSNQNDPRDRRVYATIPEGTRVKEGTGWSYEEATSRYYKDVARNSWTSPSITLDLGGIDMSDYDSSDNPKRFQVHFTTQPVVDGVVQTDLGPYAATSTRSYYILKEEPVPSNPGAYQYLYNYVYNKTIDQDYQPVSGGVDPKGSWHFGSGYYSDRNLTYISYNEELLDSQRIRYSHNNLTTYNIYNDKGDQATRELSFISSKIQVSPYTSPKEVRLMITLSNSDDIATLRAMMQGTKAYGISSDGTKTLISDNVPIVAYDKYSVSHTSDGWQSFSGGDSFEYIFFEYPETLKFVGKEQIDKFFRSIWSEVVADIRPSAYTTLVEKLNREEAPIINFKADYATTEVNGKYVVNTGEEATEHKASVSDSTRDEFRMQYEEIVRLNSVSVTNGSQFFTDDTVATRLAYTQNRYGNFSDATEPENAHIYYLVPDGLEPVEDENVFSSIEVIRGYRTGYNLVVAKPKTTSIPETTEAINGSAHNYFELNFTATNRLETGTYTIYSCLSIDNNKIGVDENGDQYGILQRDTPTGVWSDIQTNANNRPDNKTKFTNFGSTSFTIYPPLVLSSIKQVKLSSEPDSKYASSLGDQATIGTAIDYRWLLKNNSTKEIETLEIIDILPHDGDSAIVPNDDGVYLPRGSKFKTPLISVDANSKFDFYYSTDPVKNTLAENAAANWVASVADMSEVTMIKAVLKDGMKIAVGETAAIVTHNLMENNDKIQDREKAYNSFALSLNEGNSFVESLKVEAQVNYPKRDVLIEKSDLRDPSRKLYNAVFALYEEGAGENGSDLLIMENIKTNHDGIATISNLLVGKEYYLIETQAPNGFAPSDEKIRFTVQEKTADNHEQIISITNDVYRTSVSVTKQWVGPAAESVTIRLMNGTAEVDSQVLSDENNWQHTFENLEKYDVDGQEIQYSVQEVPVEGYTSSISSEAANEFTVTNTKNVLPSAPETGDDTNIVLFTVMFGVSVVLCIMLLLIIKKRNRK